MLAAVGLSLTAGNASAADPSVVTTVAADPVESITTQLEVSGTAAIRGVYTLHIKPAGGSACGANPAADDGRTIISNRSAQSGPFKSSENWEPSTAGTYLLCTWLQDDNGTGLPVAAASSSTFAVRIPKLSLAFSAPATVTPGRAFQVVTTAQAETRRAAYAKVIPDTGRGCPANWDAADDLSGTTLRYGWEVTGGPVTDSQNVTLSVPGIYLLCAYFQYAGIGTPPEATATGTLTVLAPCVVPKLIGKGRKSATAALLAANCTLGKVKKARSKKYKKDKISQVSRTVGTVLSPGAKVSVTISTGYPKKRR